MKVCFITGTLGRGGAEKQLLIMLRALRDAGIDARVLCLTSCEAYEKDIKAMGIEVQYVGVSQNRLKRLWKIINNLRAHPADIVQSSHFYTNIYAGISGRVLNIPSIGAVRSNLISEVQIHGWLGRFQVRLPRYLIANSDIACNNAIAYGINPTKIKVIRNVVEQDFDSIRTKIKPDRKITLLFVGRLSKEKRPDRFVKMAAALLKESFGGQIQFKIAGDGPLRTELETRVQNDAVLKENIEFLGECSNMSLIYNNANVLVLTSDYEGTPNVILEAMVNSLPVIATRVGGVSEILNENCGILVEPDDEISLVNAASNLIRNPDLRRNLGENGRNYARKNHSSASLQQSLTEIYSKLGADIKKKADLGISSIQEYRFSGRSEINE